MADRILLVNGLPGAGKTTLSRRLAPLLGVPLFSKDALKESAGLSGAAAAEMLWDLAAATPGSVMLESWWFKPRDQGFVAAGLARAGAASVVEIWCRVPPSMARARFVVRKRAAFYEDARRLADSWEVWAASATPLGVGVTVEVSTETPVDLDALLTRLEPRFG